MKGDGCYVGIDGCRGGWLCTIITEEDIEVSLFPELDAISAYAEQAAFIFIDMPIGLVTSAGEVREIDIELRKALAHPFRSCVFTIPCKQFMLIIIKVQMKLIRKYWVKESLFRPGIFVLKLKNSTCF
jgi:8-oxo-dGTP diphosphatase